MAIAAIVNLVASSNTGTGPTYTTLSFTPPTNQLQLIFVVNTISPGTAAGPPTPTLSGNSLTWTLENTVIFHTTTLATCRLSVYRALGTPTTGAITITPGGSPIGAAWMGITITGADTSGVNGAGAIGQETALGQNGATSSAFLTFGGAFGAGNGAIVAFAQDNTNTTAITPAGGWTEAAETSFLNPSTRIQVQWIATGDTTPDATWGGISKNSGGIGLELRIPVTSTTIGPLTETVGISDVPIVIQTGGFVTVWDGTINLLDQPKLLETITLSDVPIVTTSTAAGPRTFSSAEPLTLTDSPTLTGLILSSLVLDTLTLTDVTTLRGLTLAGLGVETLPLSDSPTVAGVIQVVQASDVLTLSETPLNVLLPIVGVLSRSVEEVLSLSEASTLQLTPLLSLVSDSTSLSESIVFQGLTLARLVSEAVSLTDSPALQGLIQRLLATDIVTLTDLPATPGVRSFGVSDTITLNDTPELELFAPITDVITLSDVPIVIVLTAVVVRSFSTSESLTLSDTPVLTGLTIPLSLSESLTLNDSSVLTGLILRLSSPENLTLTESVSTTGLTLLATPTESLLVGDLVSLTGLTLLWSTTDTLTLSDTPTVIRALEGVWQATTNDPLTLSETVVLRGLTLVSSLVETLTTSDIPIVALGAVAPRTFTTADPLTLTDNVLIAGLALPASASDLLTLTEPVSITGLIQRAVATDVLTLSDTPNFSRTLSSIETVTLTDTATVRGLALSVVTAENLTLTDPTNVFAGRRASDTIGITESVMAFTIGGIVSQPLIVFAVPARDLTATAIVGLTVFDVLARHLAVEAVQTPLVYTVEARDFTVEAIVGVTQFVVPARDLSIEAQSAA